MTATQTIWQVAYGDASNKHIIAERVNGHTVNEDAGDSITCWSNMGWHGFSRVPAGSTIYVRAWCSGTSDANPHVLAYGMGGSA
jgi:hypothetical protein